MILNPRMLILTLLFALPTHAATIASVKLVSTGTASQGDTVVTFGHYFKSGDVPSNMTVGARRSDGSTVDLQVDAKATHADGSLRHAVLTARMSSLNGGSETITLVSKPAGGASGVAVSLASLLSTDFDAHINGVSAKTLLQQGTGVLTWLSGPLVSEWIVGGPVNTQLQAYFHVRAYAGTPITRVRVDAVLENNWTFKSGAGLLSYVPSISIDGVNLFNNSGLTLNHYHHSRWHKVGWWGGDPNVVALPDGQYLRTSRAMPNYAALTLNESIYGNYAVANVPMSNANLRVNWGATGYDRQIGLFPEWSAAYVIGGDIRAYNAILANDSAGGSYGYHYRDENTGYPPSIDTYPTLSEQGPSGGLVKGIGGNSYSHEPGVDPGAHQPMLGYLAYLLTGDYYYLEELQFLANYNMLWKSPSGRAWGGSNGSFGLVGLQNRGQAWALRTLAHAAVITPDLHPLKAYFVNKTNNNITAYTTDHVLTTGSDYNVLGAVQDFDWSYQGKYSPWQNDFFVAVYGRLVELGFSNAVPMRDFLAQWPVGRLGGNDGMSGYCWRYATNYDFQGGVVNGSGAFYTSFAQLYQANFATQSQQPCPTSGLMHDGAYPNEATAYYANLRTALAYAVDAGVAVPALWDKILTMGNPDYTVAPIWSVVPRPPDTAVVDDDPETGDSGSDGGSGAGKSKSSGGGEALWLVVVLAFIGMPFRARSKMRGGLNLGGLMLSIARHSAVAALVLLAGCVEESSTSKDTGTPSNGGIPSVTLNVASETIDYGESTTITWSATDASTCDASGAWSGGKNTSGSETSVALVEDSEFILECSGTGGKQTASRRVSVRIPVPKVTIGAAPSTINYGESTTLSWTSTHARECTASGAWSGAVAKSGSQPTAALTADSTFTLTCSGVGGSVSASTLVTVVPPPQPPAAPVVTFSASPTSVVYNGSSTLTWSSSNATACSASGAWSGTKTTSGNQSLTNLTTTGTYTLACTGAGGTTTQNVTISVAPPPPTVTLSANPTSVAYDGSSTLTWSSTNATACSAGGGWSGAKSTASSETLSKLTATATYTLTCTGAGGSTNQSVTISVTSGTAGAVTGKVDSSRINRNGVNKVYLFSGSVTPDDYDGSGDAIASVPVTHDENACTFSYAFANVVPGVYTIAFTNQAANDVAGQNDAITFIGGVGITVGSVAIAQNFAAARVLKVGPGKTYAKPSLAAAASLDGDVVEIDAVEYVDDPMAWRRNNLTLRGIGGRAHIRGTQVIPFVSGSDVQNGMGLWVMRANNIVVENIEFSGARVTDENGAGIRANGNGLVVCNSYFHDNENGILGGAGDMLIEYSEFNHNGIVGDGFTHNLYIGAGTNKFTFRHNYSHHAHIGHELKTRAATNYILYNRLMNQDGDASYTIDVPNGGLTYIIGNLIQQGPNTDNSTIVNYGSEGLLAGRTDNLYIVSNTMVNDRSAGTFINAHGATKVIHLVNNLIVGNGTEVTGPAAAITKITNLNTSTPGLINRAAYDYRLTGTSPAINQGSNPGTLNGYDARPVFQYLHPSKRQIRPSSGAYDIGAYEYVP